MARKTKVVSDRHRLSDSPRRQARRHERIIGRWESRGYRFHQADSSGNVTRLVFVKGDDSPSPSSGSPQAQPLGALGASLSISDSESTVSRNKKIGIGIGVVLFLAVIGSFMDDAVDEATGRDNLDQEVEEQQTGPEIELEAATSSGLTASPAQAACNRRGGDEFPFGFRGHWIVGKLAEEIVDDRWFLKVEATVTNQFGAKRRVNVECFVGGRDDAPVVETFLAY